MLLNVMDKNCNFRVVIILTSMSHFFQQQNYTKLVAFNEPYTTNVPHETQRWIKIVCDGLKPSWSDPFQQMD